MNNNVIDKVSVFDNIWDTNNEKLSTNFEIPFILEIIKTGNHGIAEKIDRIRKAGTKEERDKLKQRLLVIMWQGSFKHRNNYGCDSLSGLVCIDLDHQDESALDHIRKTISTWPYVLAFFRSPSGDGLKILVRTDNYDIGHYSNCYRQVERIFTDAFFGIIPDGNCEDLSHPCFISYDPDMYYNPDADPWHYEYRPEFDKSDKCQQKKTSGNSKPVPDQPVSSYDKFMEKLNKARCPLTDEQIIKILDTKWSKWPNNYIDGNRTKSIFVQAKSLCLAGIDEQNAIDYIKSKFLPTGYDEYKLEYEVKRAYQKSRHQFASERNYYKSYNEYLNTH